MTTTPLCVDKTHPDTEGWPNISG